MSYITYLTSFNPVDCFLVVLLIYSVTKAFVQGFFRSAFALAGIIVGLFVASWTYHSVAEFLVSVVQSTPIRQAVAFLGILTIIMVAFSLTGRLLRRGAKFIGLGFLDRVAGAAFGLVRGWLIGVSFLLAFMAFFAAAPGEVNVPGSSWISTSKIAPYFLNGVHAVSFLVPEDLKVKIRSGVAYIKHTGPDWIKSTH